MTCNLPVGSASGHESTLFIYLVLKKRTSNDTHAFHYLSNVSINNLLLNSFNIHYFTVKLCQGFYKQQVQLIISYFISNEMHKCYHMLPHAIARVIKLFSPTRQTTG